MIPCSLARRFDAEIEARISRLRIVEGEGSRAVLTVNSVVNVGGPIDEISRVIDGVSTIQNGVPSESELVGSAIVAEI